MSKDQTSYGDFANRLRTEEKLETAGAYYTSAAYEGIRDFRWSPDFLIEQSMEYPNVSSFGWGLRELLLATLCYRLDGNEGRARNRAQQGVIIVEDVQQYEELFQNDPRQGWCHEVIGDFRLVAGLAGYDESYKKGAALYQGIENPIGWQSESEFEFFMQPLVMFANSVDYGLDDETESAIRRRSLTDRIAYKRDHYPKIVEQVVRAGNWDEK